MLVLTRRSGQSVHVGESIVVTVVKVRGQKVRLAFEAPQGVRIDRAEVRARRHQWQAPVATVDVVFAPPTVPAHGSGDLGRTESPQQPIVLTIEGAAGAT